MNTGIVKSKASGLALMGLVLMSGIVTQARAAASDTEFQLFIQAVCAGSFPQSGTWDPVVVGQMCTQYGSGAGGGAAPSINLGTTNAGGAVSTRKKKGVQDHLEEQNSSDRGASTDAGGWGLLVSLLYGKTDRTESEKENGYQSSLKGLVVGTDYRFSDSLVLGGTLGHVKDSADFLGGAGSLKTSSNSLSLFGTWLPSENVAIDGYVGYGKLTLEHQRNFVFVSVPGTVTGKTSGRQLMGGLSASYNKSYGSLSLSPYLGLDSIKTTFDAYNETGSTLLELHFSERRSLSTTSSVGTRVDYSQGYSWGTLLSGVRLAAIHEFQKNSQKISNELVIAPGATFVVETDSPDRNYLNLGFGLVAAMNNGAQFFLDYDRHTQDKLLSSWAVSLGGLFEF